MRRRTVKSATDKQFSPYVFVGLIRSRAESIVKRYEVGTDMIVEDMSDAQAILASLDGLESSITQLMLTASIAGRKK